MLGLLKRNGDWVVVRGVMLAKYPTVCLSELVC